MELFSTPLIPASIDAFWELPESEIQLADVRMIVITRRVVKGSPADTTLGKMMAACKLAPEDFAVLELPEGQVLSWSLLRGQTKATHVLLLGVMPSELGIQAMFSFLRPNNFSGVQIIPGPHLEQLVQDAGARGTLWNDGLKPAFGI